MHSQQDSCGEPDHQFKSSRSYLYIIMQRVVSTRLPGQALLTLLLRVEWIMISSLADQELQEIFNRDKHEIRNYSSEASF